MTFATQPPGFDPLSTGVALADARLRRWEMTTDTEQAAQAVSLIRPVVESTENIHDRAVELLTELIVVAETTRKVNGFPSLDQVQVREAASSLERILDSFWHRAF
jgi:hypothetical protein